MQNKDLRIALFSGNYNYVKDGANQALNTLMGYMIGQGAAVRIYSPTTDTPAFAPTGDLVSVPSFAVPGRPEYRIAYRLNDAVRRDLAEFSPNIVHVSSPDLGSQGGLKWGHQHGLPVVASVHTRFETYLRYYHLGFAEPIMLGMLRRFYNKSDGLLATTDGMADLLREQGMHNDISIWSRGINRSNFSPDTRSMEWRRSIGFADDVPVIAFLGRLVLEKAIDKFVDVIHELEKRGVKHNVLVIGQGPAHSWFAQKLPNAHFTGECRNQDLSRAVASADMLFNPSVTEAFGNVTLEAMACKLPVVAAMATGSSSIIKQGVTGFLVDPIDIEEYADKLQLYCEDPALRAQHGEAGYAESLHYDWDAINQVVADTYIRLIEARRARTAT